MKPFFKLLQSVGGAVLAAILLSGCSIYFPKQPYTSITYVSQTGVAPVAGAGEVAVKVGMIDLRSTIYKVSDYEGGEFSTATGILTATNNTASDVVKSAIETELTNRGFSLAGSNVAVMVELSRFYNVFKGGFWSATSMAKLNMNVQVKRSDGVIVYTKLITGEGSKKFLQKESPEIAKIALDAALQDAMTKLFSDGTFADAVLKAGKP
jgi:uncharacterized lipoprotein